ncbi:MAG: hypothetical protein SGI90_16680 [Candidatus Eisenbacteria bacterium]|nr:hypothetical protein [Candidatus Eisenbacteria bacterium]
MTRFAASLRFLVLLTTLMLVRPSAPASLAGEPPPLSTGGAGETATPAGSSGSATGSGPFERSSIMPELPAKMPEADALAEEERLDAGFAFERLKLLEGTWEGTAGSGAEVNPALVVWEVTAGGTALIERQFAGTGDEMMSIYHRDGDDLALTHYCAMGNQPRMRFDPDESAANLYTFRFNGGTNIGKGAIHVHAGTIHFVNANQIRAEWSVYAGSKRMGTNLFDLRRKQGS